METLRNWLGEASIASPL